MIRKNCKGKGGYQVLLNKEQNIKTIKRKEKINGTKLPILSTGLLVKTWLKRSWALHQINTKHQI